MSIHNRGDNHSVILTIVELIYLLLSLVTSSMFLICSQNMKPSLFRVFTLDQQVDRNTMVYLFNINLLHLSMENILCSSVKIRTN